MDWRGCTIYNNVFRVLLIGYYLQPACGVAVSPRISGVSVILESYCSGILHLRGVGFRRDLEVSITPEKLTRGSRCKKPEVWADLEKITANDTNAEYLFDIPEDLLVAGQWFTCVKYVNRTGSVEYVQWVHQGFDGMFLLPDPQEDLPTSNPSLRKRRESPSQIILYGLNVISSDSPWSYDDDGIPSLLAGSGTLIRLFGTGWDNRTYFVLTPARGKHGEICQISDTTTHQIDPGSVSESLNSALLHVDVPDIGDTESAYFLCARIEDPNDTNLSSWVHMGDDSHLTLHVYRNMFPLWFSIIVMIVCLSFSWLLSGLNLGLMSLDPTDLKIICNTGTPKERRYAKKILPLRVLGNYLLASILFANVMVNSIFTICIGDLTSGLVAVIGSTLAIVTFGEITPQAVCSRHSLAIGANTIIITKVIMIITWPLSYPISKCLDWVLGEEIGAVYTRERLKELVKMSTFGDIHNDEANIISGALELSQKTVKDVMTKIEDVFMLSMDAILDFETVSEIMKSGFSRIPVYQDVRSNVVSMLYIKDLALIDPGDNTPLKTVCQFYQITCYFVFEDNTLDVLFKQFKEGIRGHMAFVQRVNSEGEGDPFYETVGLITLEDVIEELIQAEINDETDVYIDNRTKTLRKQRLMKTDFSTVFTEKSENQPVHISPQLTLATFQFLSTSIDAFKPDNITETVLRRLLQQDVFYHIKKKKGDERARSNTTIYEQGKPVDFFLLILEGRVEVTVGRENLVFESGPFTYFGTQALMQNMGVGESSNSNGNHQQGFGSLLTVTLDSKIRTTFVPDYSVRAITEVFYLKVKRSLYLAAKRASLMELSRKEHHAGDASDEEVEMLMNSFGREDTRSLGTSSQQPSRKSSLINITNDQVLPASSLPFLIVTSAPLLNGSQTDVSSQLLSSST